MWYFSWVPGLGFAAAFAAPNAMWLELAPGQGLPEEQGAEVQTSVTT